MVGMGTWRLVYLAEAGTGPATGVVNVEGNSSRIEPPSSVTSSCVGTSTLSVLHLKPREGHKRTFGLLEAVHQDLPHFPGLFPSGLLDPGRLKNGEQGHILADSLVTDL